MVKARYILKKNVPHPITPTSPSFRDGIGEIDICSNDWESEYSEDVGCIYLSFSNSGLYGIETLKQEKRAEKAAVEMLLEIAGGISNIAEIKIPQGCKQWQMEIAGESLKLKRNYAL